MALTLPSICNRFIRRVDVHVLRYSQALSLPVPSCQATHAAGKERLILALHDTWCQFAREYFIVSAFRRPTTAACARLRKASGCGSYDETIQRMRLINGRRVASNWTPKWHFPNELINLATRLGLDNEPVISGVLGLPQADVLNHLTAVRNFVAHRNRSAVAVYAAFVSTAGMPSSTSPSSVIDDVAFYGNTMFIHWSNVLQYIAATMA